MPGCILRATGPSLVLATFLQQFPIPGASHRHSALNVPVSNCDGADLMGQVEDALSFLQVHATTLKALTSLAGTTVVLDFGTWRNEMACQTVIFPPALAASAGNLGIGLCVSLYAAAP